MNHCLRHYEEPIAAHCRACNQPFCSRCLVFSFGPKKPPYCVGCALHAGGVRNGQRVAGLPLSGAAEPQSDALVLGGGHMPSDKRVERAYRRAERDAVKAATKAAKRATRKGAPPVADVAAGAPAARSSQVPAPSQLQAQAQAANQHTIV